MKPQPCCVYRLYDRDEVLLYVGMSVDPQRRCSQHASTKWWWPHVEVIELEWFADRTAARRAERHALATEGSRHNLDDPDRAYYQPRPDPRALRIVKLDGAIDGLLDALEREFSR